MLSAAGGSQVGAGRWPFKERRELVVWNHAVCCKSVRVLPAALPLSLDIH